MDSSDAPVNLWGDWQNEGEGEAEATDNPLR